MKFKTLFLLALIFFSKLFSTSLDIEYWQRFNLRNFERGESRFYTVGEIRFNRDSTRFYYSRIAQCFAYPVLPWLDFELHYSYLYHKSRGMLRFTSVNRLEFELNPSFRINDKLAFKCRNRLEAIKRQNVSKIQWVFRYRSLFNYKTEGEHLVAINSSNEIFFDLDRGLCTQNRFIPLELSFKLSRDFILNTSIMLRNFHTSNKWYRSVVLGAELVY